MLRRVASVPARQDNAREGAGLNEGASDSCAAARSAGLIGPTLQDLSKLTLESEASLSALERMRRQYFFRRFC